MIVKGIESVRVEMRRIIEEQDARISMISDDSGVSQSAIRRFIHEDVDRQTRSPHFRTIMETFRALGYRIRIEER